MIGFQNWYESTLSSPLGIGTLNIPISVPPTITEGLLVLDYDIPSKREVIHFTARDGVSVTCPSSGDTGSGGTGRGYESTTARAHDQNAKVRMVFTAGLAQTIMTGAATIADQNNNKGWVARAETPVYATNNGNKEFTFTVSGDLTGVFDKGMKIKMDRTVTPPTQAMSFVAASNQYATKTTPVGISFTSAFSAEGWVYLNSYGAADMTIVSRYDGTNGFGLIVTSSGQLKVFYLSATAQSRLASTASVPLKRWTHAAGVITSVASKTGVIYMNGAVMPSSFDLTGTTALTQGGPLQIGAYNGLSTSMFDGYLAEVRLWSVAQTQSQIQANMGINLIGSETNLVLCVRGNGNFTDLTVNANTLTATNGASFVTMATTPGISYYNTTEQFIVTAKPTYSAPNTTLTVFGGTDFVLPNATLSNFYYSMQRTPFGFPASKNKWIVEAIYRIDSVQSSPTSNQWYNFGGLQLSIPAGEWSAGFSSIHGGDRGAAGRTDSMATLSTVNNTESDSRFTTGQGSGNANIFNAGSVKVSEPVNLTAQTIHYLNGRATNTGMNNLYFFGNPAWANTIIRAESAYI